MTYHIRHYVERKWFSAVLAVEYMLGESPHEEDLETEDLRELAVKFQWRIIAVYSVLPAVEVEEILNGDSDLEDEIGNACLEGFAHRDLGEK